ncbi:hypothetical protein DL96DRAFT_1684418 [Flagelloscypha sp. PMI_526]|nr:hypothetical protein DL96DRAFT_1684418 [Flagelloscypha sp. PMI_526]
MDGLVSTILNIEHLTRNGAITTRIRVDLPLDTPFPSLVSLVQPAINLDVPADNYNISPASKIAPIVTDGPSNYSPATSGGLKINFNEPLVSWFKAYRRYHGLAPNNTKSSDSTISSQDSSAIDPKTHSVVTWKDSSITIGAATFRFNRTLRVPDDATSYALPAGLGTFPLVKAQDYAKSIPDYIAQRGGYIMVTDFHASSCFCEPTTQPLFQREAMWISIDGDACAIKISVGGINAITGSKQNEDAPKGVQDYVVGGKQPWIDGVATEPGVVRQFVAMKLGHGYTIEEQLSKTTNGGIQIDVFPTLAGFVTFHHNGYQLALDKRPSDFYIKLGDIITLSTTKWSPPQTLRDIVRFATPNPIITGVVCPLTPITPALYKAHDYPWFSLYDEHLPTIQPTGNFNNLRSVRQLDNAPVSSVNALVDPDSPPDCAHHPGRKSTCIARPCGHPACVECFGAAVFGGGSCIVCRTKIEKHVGYNKPVPRVASRDGESEGIWWETEHQIEGVSIGNGTVTTLMLPEDRISELHGHFSGRAWR